MKCRIVESRWALIMLLAMGAQTQAQIRITEWMYSGTGGEFIEFTNVGIDPVDMTGWSFDDDSQLPGTVDLSAFGVVMPGESVILAEDAAAVFIADWGLVGVTVIGDLTTNLGRNDEINLYDAGGTLVDRLTYGDQTFPGTIRTQTISGYPCEDGVGANDISLWSFSEVGDAQGSYASSNGDVGSPGNFAFVACSICGNGIVEDGEDCDGGDCCIDCRFAAADTVCRPSVGSCDIEETCTGDSADCPADEIEMSGVECRPAAGPCDAAEFCTGLEADCPFDELADAGTICRSSTGSCDPAETCDGSDVGCPADEVITECFDGDGCCPSGCTANNDVDCIAICGNGKIEPGEECDDGNVEDGDGCSSKCILEFTPIPTMSEWGLLVLALMLLIGAKVRFGDRAARMA